MLEGHSFEETHKSWISSHVRRRSGERKGRLERGHQHAEKLFARNIWWKLFGHFNHLHPEYEVLDYRGRPFYVDFVWMPGHVKFAIEVKGFGPHVSEMTRKQYEYELNRETFLQGLGFRVVSIPFDSVANHPKLIISLLWALIGQYTLELKETERLGRLERDVLLLAYGLNRPIRPKDVEQELQVNRRTAVRCLQFLVQCRKLRPILRNGTTRVCRYELVHDDSTPFDRFMKR